MGNRVGKRQGWQGKQLQLVHRITNYGPWRALRLPICHALRSLRFLEERPENYRTTGRKRSCAGNKVGFSQVDMNKLNKLYKCEGTATTTTGASTTAATTAPATTVTTAGPATTTGACTDSLSFCRRIRRFCDDEDHAEDMAVACRKSCKICVNCDDKEKYEKKLPRLESQRLLRG